MLGSLALAGAVNLLAGATFLLVGIWQARRATSAEMRFASQSFGAYWAALGAYTALSGVLDLLATAGVTDFGLFLLARLVSLPILVISIGGLTFYLLYLFTGRVGWVWPVIAGYGLVLVATVWHVAQSAPVGVEVRAWRTDLHYAQPYETSGFKVILLGLVLPPVVGALAYLTLARRATRAEERYRIVLVGTSILVWSLAATLARLMETSDLVQLVSRPLLGLGAAATVVLAYRPPAGVRARLALTPVDRAERRRGLVERAHELI